MNSVPRFFWGSTIAISVLAGYFSIPLLAEPPSEVVRRDWHFRESLNAIGDWEAILERLAARSPQWTKSPVFPLPVDGTWTEWPNPIPHRLLGLEGEQDSQLHLRWSGEQIEFSRGPVDSAAVIQTAAPAAEIVGCVHPGGGGKDQWYHHYERRFDRLLRFRGQRAPFCVALRRPPDLAHGENDLGVRFRNVRSTPLRLTARLDFHRPRHSRLGKSDSFNLAPGEDRSLHFALSLDAPGGGLAVLEIETEEGQFSIPLLTHVEAVGPVLNGIEQILTDAPDLQAADRLAALRQRQETTADHDWRALFEEASALRDELLLARISFDRLLFVKRKPYFSEQPFMDAHHLLNRPGGGIYQLHPPRPTGRVTAVVDSLGSGVYRDICLHWDAQRLLFAFGNGSDKWDGSQSYHIYEVGTDGRDLRQLTSGPKNDCEPFYLPDDRIAFTSDRSEHFVMCGGDRHAPTLYVANANGSEVRQLGFNVFNEFNPTLLPDGRILYGRWEYNERSVTSLHNPFVVNPDGTMVSPYYGNATIRPNVVMFPRPVPGSSKVMALFTAHHGQTHGSIGLIDIRRGRDGSEPLEILTPGVPVLGEHSDDSRYGWYSDPQPLSEHTYLCSFTPTVLPWLEWSWALYVGDRHGNLALVYRDAEISCAEPVPLVPRQRPHVVPSILPESQHVTEEATLAVADVYLGLPDVPRGEARYLRILEDVPRKSVPAGGVVLTSGTQIYTIKRVLGTVPVEPDGSAYFTVPADRNIYFEVLDDQQREIRRMRSVVTLKSGERRVCIGCHEHRNTAPPNTVMQALARQPSQPQPPPWGDQILSFLRDVQPVLNEQCIACHTHDRLTASVILTDDLTAQFNIAYEELLPYVTVATSKRWDYPEDVYPQPPYRYGSKVSPLIKLLESGHHGVTLSDQQWQRLVNWIDANAVYYDRYESESCGPNRQLFPDPLRRTMAEVFARRCASCHSVDDGQFDTWWMSFNRRDTQRSRALIAPLAVAAGGWQRCGKGVFADRADADYQKLLAAFTDLSDRLAQRPREDLLSIAGTDAGRQPVTLPPPPPPHESRTHGQPPSPGDWILLNELAWQSGNSGWTPNGDNLPRRNRDVEGQPLRLGSHRVRQGIGTHAPSEIVYSLGARYDRFQATVGGGEEGGTVEFQVLGDGRLLFSSGVLHGLAGTKLIDVSVADVDQLHLVVTDGGDGYHCDMATWGKARLRVAGGTEGTSAEQPSQ